MTKKNHNWFSLFLIMPTKSYLEKKKQQKINISSDGNFIFKRNVAVGSSNAQHYCKPPPPSLQRNIHISFSFEGSPFRLDVTSPAVKTMRAYLCVGVVAILYYCCGDFEDVNLRTILASRILISSKQIISAIFLRSTVSSYKTNYIMVPLP